MQTPERSILAGELAQAFAYAELHCNLLRRYLKGKLPAIPQIPPFDDEEAMLDSLAKFVDAANVLELRAALCGVSAAFLHAASGGFRSGEECTARIDTAKKRLKKARRWLTMVEEGGDFVRLKQMDWPSASARRAAVTERKPAPNESSFK